MPRGHLRATAEGLGEDKAKGDGSTGRQHLHLRRSAAQAVSPSRSISGACDGRRRAPGPNGVQVSDQRGLATFGARSSSAISQMEYPMPIYEYRCRECHRRVSVFLRSFSDIETANLKCTYCGHDELDRLVSRVAVLKSEDARLDALADGAALGDIDENDPRSIARWMKKMAAEVGEDMGDEFHEAIDRMEAGQSLEEIETSMPDLGPPSASEMAGYGPLEDDL